MDIALAIFTVFVALAISSFIAVRRYRMRLRRMAVERVGETFDTFVSSLDTQRLDTQVIRGVYQGIQISFDPSITPFPLRPSDRIEDDLKIDPEDIESIVADIAAQSGRTMDSAETSPWNGKIATVSDLIEFLCLQPRINQTAAPVPSDT